MFPTSADESLLDGMATNWDGAAILPAEIDLCEAEKFPTAAQTPRARVGENSSCVSPVAPPNGAGISLLHCEAINLCVRLAYLAGLPTSTGEIFGYLFFAEVPKTLEEIVADLHQGRDSVRRGLRLLRRLGTVVVRKATAKRGEVFLLQRSLREMAKATAAESFLFEFAELADGVNRLQNGVLACDHQAMQSFSERLNSTLLKKFLPRWSHSVNFLAAGRAAGGAQ